MITNRRIALALDEALANMEEAKFCMWCLRECWAEAVNLWVDEAFTKAVV